MMEFKRYPHVRDLIVHYANRSGNENILDFLNRGIKSKKEAVIFSKFILTMIDRMAKDMQEKVVVLGSTDNTSMIPDIDYEVSLYLANQGMEKVWDEVCDTD